MEEITKLLLWLVDRQKDPKYNERDVNAAIRLVGLYITKDDEEG